MKKLVTILSAVLLTFGLMAQTDAGTFYMAFGNAYSPMGEMHSYIQNSSSATAITALSGTGMSLGNEWTTGITIDGDDDDDNGNDFFDKDDKSKAGNFNIGFQFGAFAANGLLLGVGVEYARVKVVIEDENDEDGDGMDDEYFSKSVVSSLAFSPFIKYYINVAGANALFLSSSYTFGTMNSSWEWEQEYTSFQDQDDDDRAEPYKTSRLEFGTGMAFFLTESISLEPSVNYAFNRYAQEVEFQVYNSNNGSYYYDDQDVVVFTNAFYFKIAASLFL